jgi:uncharacterized protein Usg
LRHYDGAVKIFVNTGWVMSQLALQLNDYRLTTAKILYHLPDHPALLQSYLWQDYDLAPDFPVLRRFLDFWRRSLDGRLHSVEVASQKLIRPAAFRHATAQFTLH